MGLTTAGMNHLLGLGVGEALTSFATANSYLGVGDSSTAFAIAQTDLQAASNKTRKAVSSTSRSSNVVTSVATFTTSDANYTWSEFGLFNASSAGVMLHRGVSASFFVKNASTVAVLTITLTVTAA